MTCGLDTIMRGSKHLHPADKNCFPGVGFWPKAPFAQQINIPPKGVGRGSQYRLSSTAYFGCGMWENPALDSRLVALFGALAQGRTFPAVQIIDTRGN